MRIHAWGTKRINHPVVGEMTIAYNSLSITSTPGVSVRTYLPAPGTASMDALELLRNWVAGGRRHEAHNEAQLDR